MRNGRVSTLGALIGVTLVLYSCSSESPTTSLPEDSGARGLTLQAISPSLTAPLADGVNDGPLQAQCKFFLDTAIAIVNAASSTEFHPTGIKPITSHFKNIVKSCDSNQLTAASDQSVGAARFVLGREATGQIASDPFGDVAPCTTNTADGAVGDRLLGCFSGLAGLFGTGVGVGTPAGGGSATTSDGNAIITFPPGFFATPTVVTIQTTSCAGFPSTGAAGETCVSVNPTLFSANFDPEVGCTAGTCASICLEAGAGNTAANTAIGTFTPNTTTLELLLPPFNCTPPGDFSESKVPQGGLRLASPGGVGGTSPHSSPFFPTSTGTGTTFFQATFTADTLNLPPGSPETGTWTLNTSAGTILVRSAVGDLTSQPVELAQSTGPTGGVSLLGTVAGTPPSTGVVTARWRSLSNSTSVFFGPIVLRDSGALILASVEYRPGGDITYNSPTNVVGSWTTGVSQLFEVTVDFGAGTTSLSIDGSPVSGAQGVAFVQSATDLARLGFELGGTFAQTFGWDDIEVVGP